MRIAACLAFAAVTYGNTFAAATQRTLSFDQRVDAQRAIERVYYRHQLDATKPFEDAVPRAALEGKVRKYLDQSAALQAYWKTAITDDSLERELVRMAAGTQMPERLRELFAALGNDSFLIKECLARPTLVDRLTHNFYAYAVDKSSNARPGASWDSWWETARLKIRDAQVAAVASDRGAAPLARPSRPSRSASTCLADGWDNGTLDDGPEALPGATSVWTGSVMLVWGGDHHGRGWRYDPATDTWTAMSTFGAPESRFSQTAVWAGTVMIVWGGATEAPPFRELDSGGRYDPATDTWSPTSIAGAPAARSNHTAVWTGSSMVVWGGYAHLQHLGSGGRYDPGTDSWTPTSMVGAPSARAGHVEVWTGSRVFVWGGYSEVDLNAATTGARYDPAADTWTPTSTVGAPDGSVGLGAVWTGSLVIVWNGTTGGRYDPVSDSWSPVATGSAPSGRPDSTLVWTGSRMVAWGGGEGSGTLFNTGARYDPAADQWTPTSTVGAPSAREGFTSVWTGQLMIVWGGATYSSATGFTNFLSTGGRYDPATDTWTPTATGPAGAPSPRSGHTAVWTGNQMLIWGGDEQEPAGVSPLGTGGRYDPATDAWTPIASTNAPSPRVSHTAVWAGNEMVVWGGGYFNSPPGTDTTLNTGGRYNPLTDTWTPTSIAGAPTARTSHTAVWTGSKVVIWGGHDVNYNLPLTGGRYDPASDSWAPTSTSGAPAAREQHSAVWTGSKMVVWGGYVDDIDGRSGGRYDPVSDTWAATSTVGAPASRVGHAAIWTGSEMLIWGGAADPPAFDGASYNPVTNAWQPMTRIGQPAALEKTSAIWTGDAMIVWGGGSFDIPTGTYTTLSTGGRYNPVANSWRATTTVGAPSGRYGHTAVWTGSRMVVWGGARSTVKLASGGRYAIDVAATEDCDGDGTTVATGDCNDADPSVYPGAAETCNGVDEDCDGTADDGGNALCDDANPCMTDTCQPQGGCVHVPTPEGTDCDNQNGCDGYESCNGYGYCVSSNEPYCYDFNPCTRDECDPLSGCVYFPAAQGTPCPDSDACNGAEVCDGNFACVAGPPVAPPSEVDQVRVSGQTGTAVTWLEVSGAAVYDVASSTVSDLRTNGTASAACLADNVASVTSTDARPNPAAGDGYYYLIRAQAACGSGTYGLNSAGMERVLPAACP